MSITKVIARCVCVVGVVAALAAGRAGAQPIMAVRMGTTAFSRPVLVTAPRGDTQRLFVLEQTGTIKVMNATTGAVNATPFLTVPGVLYQGEGGLLGLAFHPDYANNGYFYIYYSRSATGGGQGRVIARYKVSAANPDVADPDSATLIYFYASQIAIHNGGTIAFGPADGMLYIAWGNRGVSTNSPDLTTPLGKILRIDVNGPDGVPGTADDDQFPTDDTKNYCIPSNNPFVGVTGEDEIWAYGLRNPWRDSFDRATGELYITDVGDATWEEVDVAPPAPAAPGRNYGYPCMEGLFCLGSTTSSTCACNTAALTPPVFNYSSRSNTECAIVGGYVYRGCAIPWINGQYFFGDYCSSKIWSGRWNGTSLVEVTDRTSEVWGATLRPGILSFGEDARGELYICSSSGNAVYKIVPATLPDCNGNGVADGCDIAAGVSRDVDHNQMPDECQNPPPCVPCVADFDQDGDSGTDADIEAFFRALGGHGPFGADFNGDGDSGTDADIEAFFRVLGGGVC